MKKIILIGLILLIGTTSCNSDDDNIKISKCDLNTIISSEQFTNAPAFPLTIMNLEIDENCLKIKFSASGCNGETWITKLIDSGDIMESDPPQRNLRLSLKSEELCEAMVIKELTFDISNLQVDGNRVYLNITNSDEQILYEY